ncbi:MAG: class I SAM-dependent methyltransferase [bacterium]
MNKPAFFDWLDHRRAAERQHAEIARLTGIGTGRLLEIGSGDGTYLQYFQDHGWECLGIEPDASLAERALLERQVLTLQVSPVEAGIPAGSYDLVRIRFPWRADNPTQAALHHPPGTQFPVPFTQCADDPAQTVLRLAYEALVPTGYLIAETWNGSGWPYREWTRDLSRRFDKRTFPKFVQGAGFEIGGIIAPRLGDPVWFPLSRKGWRAADWRKIPDAILGFFDRGSMLVLFGQKPG